VAVRAGPLPIRSKLKVVAEQYPGMRYNARGSTVRRQNENRAPAHRRIAAAASEGPSSFSGLENAGVARHKGSSRTSAFGDDITNIVARGMVQAPGTEAQNLEGVIKQNDAIAERRSFAAQSKECQILPPPIQVTSMRRASGIGHQSSTLHRTFSLPALARAPACIEDDVYACKNSLQPRCPGTICKETIQEQRDDKPSLRIGVIASVSRPSTAKVLTTATKTEAASRTHVWFDLLDQNVRDDMHRFFAEAAAHYGKWCEEASLDAMTKWGLSRDQVHELLHLFQTRVLATDSANAEPKYSSRSHEIDMEAGADTTLTVGSTAKRPKSCGMTGTRTCAHSCSTVFVESSFNAESYCAGTAGIGGKCTNCSRVYLPSDKAKVRCGYCGRALDILDSVHSTEASSYLCPAGLLHEHTTIEGQVAANDADMSMSSAGSDVKDFPEGRPEQTSSQEAHARDLADGSRDDLMEASSILENALSRAEVASSTGVPNSLIRQHLNHHLRRLCRCPKVAAIVSMLPNTCRDSSGDLVHLELGHIQSLHVSFKRAVDGQAHSSAIASESNASMQLISTTPTTHAQSTQFSMPESFGSIAEYAPDALEQLFRSEADYQPRSDYMEQQTDINGRMRSILVDWLVEVHRKYKLRVETLFLSIALIDRFLSRKTVLRRRLQLVGVCALLVASKFEDIHPPEVDDLIYVCDNAYTRDDMLDLEVSMLTALNFRITCPTVVHFLEPFCQISQCDALHRNLAQYIAELALFELALLRYSPSHLAAASLLLSNTLLGSEPVWPAATAHYARHSQQALTDCAEELKVLLRAAPTSQLKAVRSKFSRTHTMQVATLRF